MKYTHLFFLLLLRFTSYSQEQPLTNYSFSEKELNDFHFCLDKMYSDPENANSYYNTYTSNSQNVDQGQILDLILQAKRNQSIDDNISAIEIYSQILSSYHGRLTPKWVHSINNYTSISLRKIGAINEALLFNEKSLFYCNTDEGQKIDWYYFYEDHALMLLRAKRYDDAEFYFRTCLDIAIKGGNKMRVLHSNLNIGLVFKQKGEIIRAKNVFYNAILLPNFRTAN